MVTYFWSFIYLDCMTSFTSVAGSFLVSLSWIKLYRFQCYSTSLKNLSYDFLIAFIIEKILNLFVSWNTWDFYDKKRRRRSINVAQSLLHSFSFLRNVFMREHVCFIDLLWISQCEFYKDAFWYCNKNSNISLIVSDGFLRMK